ncbi:hypothetical protein Ciccas_012034, partial [Cichlidogyrus casuarinus]
GMHLSHLLDPEKESGQRYTISEFIRPKISVTTASHAELVLVDRAFFLKHLDATVRHSYEEQFSSLQNVKPIKEIENEMMRQFEWKSLCRKIYQHALLTIQ